MSNREFWALMSIPAFALLYLLGHVIHAVVWGAWS